MDKREFATFAMALRTYYPKEQILPNKEAMQLWFTELCDIPFDVATAALRKWVNTEKWSPSISEIRDMCFVTVNGDPKTWQDGWDTVLTAIRKFGIYDPKEAMDYLNASDPVAASCVLRLGYRNLCMSESAVADRAAFRTCYEVMQKRSLEDQKIPVQLRDTIKSIQLKDTDTLKLGE